MILEGIHQPKDLKELNHTDLTVLAGEIRTSLIKKISQTGGHLASNLGTVEMTIALHYVFDSPTDKIIFDVSHQCYTHKILTGRKDAFTKEEKYNEVSGFSNPSESEHDFFNIGHTSTSISLACGLAKARDLMGEKCNVIAVIGDGSLDGGEAFEALNYSAELNGGLIIVVNDNDMSIAENHGGLCQLLTSLRTSNGETSNNYFKALGLEYIFVRDGHNIDELIYAFSRVKDTDHPVVIHCCTKKGKGLSFAEQNTENWHWAYPFDEETGEIKRSTAKENYGEIAGEFLLEKLQKEPEIAIVTAATSLCIGFNERRRHLAGKQFIDVGIAEQHAISMVAGIAKYGGKPIFATQSTFYQRAYDQIEQELCISKCPGVMIVTHTGIKAHANDTHAGLFDISLLGNIPNLTYLAPTNKQEYLAMLEWGIEQNAVPVAIRVPWNGVHYAKGTVDTDYSIPQYRIISSGSKVAIIGLGSFFQLGEQVAQLLQEESGIVPTLINPRFITGIDADTLDGLKHSHTLVVTLEDGLLSGGFGAKIAQYYGPSDMKVLNRGFSMDIPNRFTEAEMLKRDRLTPEQITADILQNII